MCNSPVGQWQRYEAALENTRAYADPYGDMTLNVRYQRQDLVSAGHCLAEPGVQALVYLPHGGSVDVELDGAPYAVTWINALAPADRPCGPPTGSGQGLVAPAGGDDWLLYLRAQ